MDDDPFERSRRDRKMKIIFGIAGLFWVGVFVVLFVWLPARRDENVRALQRPLEDAWSRAAVEHHDALRDALTKGSVVPRPDLGRCDLPKEVKQWNASDDNVDFAEGHAYARQVPRLASKEQVAAWEREVASWDREIDFISAPFARNLIARSDPKKDYDPAYQTMHFYVWDFHQHKIVCAATQDLGAALDASRDAEAVAKRVEVVDGREVEITARRVGETTFWRAGPPK